MAYMCMFEYVYFLCDIIIINNMICIIIRARSSIM